MHLRLLIGKHKETMEIENLGKGKGKTVHLPK
jgi:hypothetical protein